MIKYKRERFKLQIITNITTIDVVISLKNDINFIMNIENRLVGLV